jgi:hypothetical protein
MKSVLNHTDFSHETFSLEKNRFEDCYEIGQQIIREYNKISSIEVWNPESFNSTLNQIEYYRDAGGFKTRSDLKAVIASFEMVLDYLQMQADKGQKPLPNASITSPAKFEFYVNEIIIGSNTILLELDGNKLCILTYSVLKYLMTKDETVCQEAFDSFENLKSRSSLISRTGER